MDDAVEGRRRTGWIALVFLLPALVLLGALVVYPIFFSVYRSLFDKSGDAFVGIDNYQTMFASSATLTAIKNTLIWVVVAPSVVTALGLIFAVLSERIRWSTAFKFVIFMPMAVSFLSAGVTWRLIYEENPNLGLANAAVHGVADVVRPPGILPGARPTDEEALRPQGESYVTSASLAPGDTAELGLVAIPQDQIPRRGAGGLGALGARPTASPAPCGSTSPSAAAARRGRSTPASGACPASPSRPCRGRPSRDRRRRIRAAGSRSPASRRVSTSSAWRRRTSARRSAASPGSDPTLVTPAIIVAYIWIWAGFAMVVIGAGLAAIPREVLEASRVEGASEWQVFRRVTVPLLAPVLGVVLVTLIINVLKIFDLVLVIAPGSAQRTANVIALQMWKTAFGVRDFGLGSALAIFLFLLVIPAMAFNIRRFRAEQ